MLEIGRLCIKIAGRDAGKKCVVVDSIDSKSVLIDGETRRRKCNAAHLEPLDTIIKIKKNASHEEIKKEFDKLSLKARETKPRPKTVRTMAKRKTPDQLRAQKEEKKKQKSLFKKKAEESEKKLATELESKLESAKAETKPAEQEIKAETQVAQ